MLKRIKNFGFSIGIFSLIMAPFAFATSVYAAGTTTDIQNCLSSGSNLNVDTAANGNDCTANNGNGGTDLNSILKLIINVFSAIVGFIAVIMIIYGGVKYITSGGESGNISGAKNTIVYAIVGLIIVALAQVLVHFVLSKVSSTASTSGGAQ